MKNIETFDRTNLKMIRKELEAALSEACAKHGLSSKMAKFSFSDNDFDCKITISTGSNDDAARRAWKENAFRFNMPADAFGKTFTQGGDSFTICGIKPRARKHPIIAERTSDGQKFIFPTSYADTAS